MYFSELTHLAELEPEDLVAGASAVGVALGYSGEFARVHLAIEFTVRMQQQQVSEIGAERCSPEHSVLQILEHVLEIQHVLEAVLEQAERIFWCRTSTDAYECFKRNIQAIWMHP